MRSIYSRVQKLICWHLFTQLLHEDFPSIVRKKLLALVCILFALLESFSVWWYCTLKIFSLGEMFEKHLLILSGIFLIMFSGWLCCTKYIKMILISCD